MGQQIAAEHELFSGKSAGEATKAVDLSFDDGSDKTGALDMDLAGGADDGASDIIDLGADSAEVEAVGDASSIDFAFDDAPDATPAEESSMDDVFSSPAADVSADEETADTPAVEEPAEEEDTSASVETPTIEQQFENLDPTGELPALDSAADDELTELASLDDEFASTDATAEINLDDLGLDLNSLGDSSLAADIESDAATMESVLEDTASVSELSMDDLDATGENPEIDIDDATGKNPVLPDFDDLSIPGDDPESETSLLDATGQTQVLPDDFAVETASDIDSVIGDDAQTMMAQTLGDDNPLTSLPAEAETLLAPLDDDDDLDFTKTEALPDGDTSDFDFAKTEALPKDVFIGDPSTDETGELPALTGVTDMDLDLDDLTAALKVSEVGDTVNQRRDEPTVQQPRIRVDDRSDQSLDLDIGADLDDDDDVPTQALSPEQVSGDLHDARTMTEVGTKLDLARAYVDMGDPSGARSILEEVLDEGDAGQRQQAQQLLDSLPS